MMTLFKSTLFLCAILLTSILNAQSYTIKVIDEKSGEPVAFATVETGEHQGVITNEEGVFTLNKKHLQAQQDSIYISSMGYDKKGLFLKSDLPSIVSLVPTTIALKSVFVSNNPLSPDEIIEKVKEHLESNYKVDLTKKSIFFRQSDFNRMNKIDFGFKKSTIEELNKELMDSIADIIPKQSYYYREVVGDFYGDYSKHKFHITKAAELYDKSKDLSLKGMSDRLEKIFKDNVKPDSYLKIKSGIFGTKVQLDSLTYANEDAKEMKMKIEDTVHHVFQEQMKSKISSLYEQLFFHEDSKIDILEKSNRYKFLLEDYTFIDDVPVYILKFTPKGSKKFEGVMYVNTTDFAIVRLEFNNVRPLTKFGLLGITYRNNVYRGKMLFKKDVNGGYSPRYIELEDGNYFAIDRPLKIIEKNKHVKGRRKQNELSLALDIRMTQLVKYELVVFNSETISDSSYDAIVENKKVKATYLSKYDPTFWEEYTIMEPNEAIRSFTVLEE